MLWFTSDVGIIKYNSKTFELLNTDNGLSHNEVFGMHEDSKGRIWIMTANGKPCYLKNGKIYNEHNDQLLKQLAGNSMFVDFFMDNDNNIYFTFRNGEILILNKDDSVKKISTFQASLSGVWQNKHIYTVSSEAVYEISEPIKKASDAGKSQYRVSHTNGKTYVSWENHLYTAGEGVLEKKIELAKLYHINKVVEEGDKIWFCTRTGLVLYENNTVKQVYFKDCIVSDFFKDMEGNYWITTLNKGILFVPSFNINLLLKDTRINCLAVHKEKELWIGGFDGDYYIKKNAGLKSDSLNTHIRKDKITNIRMFNDTVYVLGKVGIKMHTQHGQTSVISSINDILWLKQSKILATTYTAKIDNSEFNAMTLRDFHNKRILMKRTNVLCADEEENVWIGTNFGLHKYTAKNSLVDLGLTSNDLSVSIEDLFYDKENQLLFIATASNGLVILKNDSVYKKVANLDGLNSNTIASFKKTGSNSYLVGSNNGLNKVVLNTELGLLNIINLNSYLGIKNKRIKDIETVEDTVFLATDNGLLYFNSNLLGGKKVLPTCIITGINAFFETADKISYKNNSISISFNGISFIDGGDVKYFYKLENQDKEWFATDETQINYKSLPAGKYMFSVYCVNGMGEKSSVQNYNFEVLPPFWQKWWFRIFSVLLIVAGSTFFVRNRFKKQQHTFEKERVKINAERDKAKMEKRVLELEQKALRLQMNPHFIFNALNTIKGYYAENDFIQASNYITKFSKLLRSLLENEEQVNTLESEIEMLKLYIELTQIRYQEKFDYTVTIAPDIQAAEVLLPTLLLQPLVENAIIYGLGPKTEKGHLAVDFSISNGQLVCVVEDDGIGRKAALERRAPREYKSKAGDIIKERLALFDSNCKIEYIDKEVNGIALGTKVLITLPVKKNM